MREVLEVPGERRGIELGLRVGYGIPLGGYGRQLEATPDESFGHWVDGQSPIDLDAGYRWNPNFYSGLALQYAFVFANKANVTPCDGVCMQGLRIDVAFAWHIRPSAVFDPWVGIGAGYEWLASDQRITRFSARGLEFINLQIGGDFAVGGPVAVGPFVSFSLGQFSSSTIVGGPYAGTRDFFETAVHGWLIFGARASFDIPI